jgi:hypothetical protein
MKRWRWNVMIVAGLLVLPGTAAWGAITMLCRVAYKTGDGFYSEYQTKTVTFMTGFELREATDSLRYDWDDIYALVQMGEEEVAILNLDTAFALPGPSELNVESVKAIFDGQSEIMALQEFAGEKRRWRVKAREANGHWIDPRLD